MGDARHLRGIPADATPEEVAAILAAVAVVEQERAASAAAAAGASEGEDPQRLDAWRTTNRLAHRRAGMTRGPWRLSGRVRRRTRA